MNPIVERMYSGDLFSQWLGIERIEERPGYCELRMTVRQEMINGFGIAHGAITYALADSALAFASNASGKHAVSIETSINHLKPVRPGDILRAVARETSRSNKLGIYHIEVWRDEVLVAHFKGVVFIKDQAWEV
jgi:acyl-CoA thioesterase